MKKNKGNTKKKKNIRNKYSKLCRMRNDRDVYLKDSNDMNTSLILPQCIKQNRISLTDLNNNPSIKPNLNNVGNDLDDFSILTNINDNSLNTPKSGDHK